MPNKPMYTNILNGFIQNRQKIETPQVSINRRINKFCDTVMQWNTTEQYRGKTIDTPNVMTSKISLTQMNVHYTISLTKVLK